MARFYVSSGICTFLALISCFRVFNEYFRATHISKCKYDVRERIYSNRSQIFCLVLTLSNFREERNRMLVESWFSQCDGGIIMTQSKSFGIIYRKNAKLFDVAPSSHERMWLKTLASIEYAYNTSLEFEWFVIVCEDTYVQISNLRRFLNRFNPQQFHYFGYAWLGLIKTGHEGGYILSRSSLSWLAEIDLLKSNATLCSGKFLGSERIRCCLQKAGVYSGIDPDIHKVFIPRKSMSNPSPKIILAWNTILRRDIAKLAENHSKNCPAKCIFSSDKSLLDKADAITFHMHPFDAEPFNTLPMVRYSWQRYIFINTETYKNPGFDLPQIKSTLFNWSMTYRRDSDIRFDYYGQLLRQAQTASYQAFVNKKALNKSKMVAWLVGNCNAHSKRLEYVKELENYISIDRFGCDGKLNFSYSCPRDPERYGHWCRDIPFTEYRFYLAFENSVCHDYVSEKFYQALDRLMVPIVLRNADYLEIAPRDSYIAADEFRTPRDLADYLHYLASKPDEYLKYFAYTRTNKVVWKENHMIEDGICRLCHMLHENRTSTTGSPMHKTWIEQVECVEEFGLKLLLK